MNIINIILIISIFLAEKIPVAVAAEKPWGEESRVEYDHTLLRNKHMNISTSQAIIGEFARHAIRLHSQRRRLAAGDFDELNRQPGKKHRGRCEYSDRRHKCRPNCGQNIECLGHRTVNAFKSTKFHFVKR